MNTWRKIWVAWGYVAAVMWLAMGVDVAFGADLPRVLIVIGLIGAGLQAYDIAVKEREKVES